LAGKTPIVHGGQITCVQPLKLPYSISQNPGKTVVLPVLPLVRCCCGSTPKLPAKLPCQHARDATTWSCYRLMQMLTIGQRSLITQQ
jgi:hypothetical protein